MLQISIKQGKLNEEGGAKAQAFLLSSSFLLLPSVFKPFPPFGVNNNRNSDEMSDDARLEKELVARARKGDDAAFENLVRMHQRQLYGYLYRLSGDMDDAMEITQNAFVKAYQSMGRFRGDSSFKTWLFRIASNTWKNTIRDRSRRKTVQLDTVPLSSPHDPLNDAVESQERAMFAAAVKKLPPRQKQALVLRAQEGCSFDEVARIMNCSTGAAKASYHHAVGKLKVILKGEKQ
jgi:RNA polymerase sigma-70 factor (ECF subfamily)